MLKRKRVANFTAYEKALLKQLIKRRPTIEDKSTDGKSIAEKQVAWASLTKEFNCNANVHKRETITLKRAWDNMKASMRKANEQTGKLLRKKGEQLAPPLVNEALVSKDEGIAPVIKCEINNTLDFDDPLLKICESENTQEQLNVTENIDRNISSASSDTSEVHRENNLKSNEDTTFEVQENSGIPSFQNGFTHSTGLMRRPVDYIRREAMTRIKHLENKKKLEMQILQTQLEVEEIKKRTALMEEERSKILLKKVILELQELKKSNSVLADSSF